MTDKTNRQLYLHQRPDGLPSREDVRLREVPVPEPGPGEVLIRNHYFSIDPAIRGWMSDVPNYLPPIPLGDPVRSTVLGEVVSSNYADLKPGDRVVGLGGWEEYGVAHGATLFPIPDDGRFPAHYYVNILGAVGLTPYFGLLEAGKIKEGETVLMSAAAGAVGSVGGQIAKIKGCRVVGLAGTDEKCRWIQEELGYDAAINYRSCGDLEAAIRGACPEGVDVFFDNVGGAILDAALLNLRHRARIVFCGAIASYNASEPVPGPYNYWQILARSATVQGYLVSDYLGQFPQGIAQLGDWIEQGRIHFREEIVDGFENTLDTFLKLFDGSNEGKLIIRLAAAPADS